MILPNQPVKITISPIDEEEQDGQPVKSDRNNPTNPRPEGGQRMNRYSSDHSSILNPAYQQLMNILEKTFCMREINATCGQSEEWAMSSLHRNGDADGNESSPSSSLHQADQQQSRQESESNSQPVVHNENNDNWFEQGIRNTKNPNT